MKFTEVPDLDARSNPNSPEYVPGWVRRKMKGPLRKPAMIVRLKAQREEEERVAQEVAEMKIHRAFLLRASDAQKKQWVKDNPYYACLMYLPGQDGNPLRLMDFHVEILEKFFRGGRYDIMLATDHMKSWLGTFVFPILSLMNDPNEAHILCCSNIQDARRRLNTIRIELETNALLARDFPWVTKPSDKNVAWSTLDITVAGCTRNSPNPSVHAGTIGGDDVRQRRGKLMMDDCEGHDHRRSPTKRQSLYDFVKMAGVRCFEDKMESSRPLVANLGTPFDVDSIHFRLQSEGWDVVRYPAYIGDPNAQTWERQYLWPQKRAKIEEQRKFMSRLQFSIAYLLDPTAGDMNAMSYEDVVRFSSGADFTQGQPVTLVTLDPASGSKTRRADYAGLAVVRGEWAPGEPIPTLDVLEAYRFTEGIFEQVGFAAKLARDHDCAVIYETNSQQGMNYKAVFDRVAPDVKLIGHYTSAHEKWDERLGVTIIKTLVRDRKLRVPQGLLEEDGIRTLLTEIRDLRVGSTADDHISSALWFVVRWMEKTRGRIQSLPKFKLVGRAASPWGRPSGFGGSY